MNCPTGKISYPSPAAAWRIIKRMGTGISRYTHTKSGQDADAYHCKICGEWHITHRQRTIGRPAQEVA